MEQQRGRRSNYMLNETAVYLVPVDYGMSVERLIWLGHYDSVNINITSQNFPTKRKDKTELTIVLAHFNRLTSDDEVIRELDKVGYRPAEAHELLAFAVKYPDIQRKFSILALGSVWRSSDKYPFVLCLDSYGIRRLKLSSSGTWNEVCRFAAVRK